MDTNEITTVTYNFEDGSKVVQPITKQSMFDDKKRKRTIDQLCNLFQQTSWDKRAIGFVIDSEINTAIVNEKEIHFTKFDKKLAKAKYRQFERNNPKGFKKSQLDFQNQLINAITYKRKLGMNIKNVKLVS